MKRGMYLFVCLALISPTSAVISSDIEFNTGVSVGQEITFDQTLSQKAWFEVNKTTELQNRSSVLQIYIKITNITETAILADVTNDWNNVKETEGYLYTRLGNLFTSITWEYWTQALEDNDTSIAIPLPATAIDFEFSFTHTNEEFAVWYEYAIGEGIEVYTHAVYDKRDGVAITWEHAVTVYQNGELIYVNYDELQRVSGNARFRISAPGLLILFFLPILAAIKRKSTALSQ